MADVIHERMRAPYFSLNIGGSVVYAKMPGGNVRLPLIKNERDELIAALREALDVIGAPVSSHDVAKGSD